MGGGAPCCDPEDVPASFVAGLAPRTRLLAALAFVLAVITIKSWVVLILAVAAALLLVALSRQTLHALTHRLIHIEGFMLVLLAFLPFTMPGETIFSLGPLAATKEGLLRAVTIILKVNAAAVAIFALIGSLEPVQLGRALAELGVPTRLVHLFLFAVRYVSVFRAETARLVEAMRVRAFHASSNWHTWRTLGNLSGMMLVRSVERAERVREAMLCRGFNGQFPLTASVGFSLADVFFGVAFTALLAALVYGDRLA